MFRSMPNHQVFLYGLCLSLSAMISCAWSPAVQAKDTVAIFVQAVGNNVNDKARLTSGEVNWLMRKMVRKDVTTRGMQLLNRGMFFSNAEALAAGNWLRRAKSSLREGVKNYSNDPTAAMKPLLKSSRFFEYTFNYYSVMKDMQKALIYAGLLYWRKGKGSKSRARRMLETGILLRPKKATSLSQISSQDKDMIRAVRCKLSKKPNATLKLQSRNPRTELYINNKFVGFGKVELKDLKPGTYMIRAMLDGYRHYKRKYRLRKRGRVFVRNRPGPRISFYEGLCKNFMQISNDEQLKDEMKKTAVALRNKGDNVKRLLIGCFQPQGSGRIGIMKWFALNKGTVEKGSAVINPSIASRLRSLEKPLKKLGLVPDTTTQPKIRRYAALASQGSCQDPNNIELPSLVAARSGSGVWNVSPGDVITLSTRYGFRIQGKVKAIQGKTLTLEVSTNQRDPSALREIKIQRKEVKWTFVLGRKQEGGFRIGERLIIVTVFGLVVRGALASDDGNTIVIQTRRGKESLSWKMIRRVIRRDS